MEGKILQTQQDRALGLSRDRSSRPGPLLSHQHWPQLHGEDGNSIRLEEQGCGSRAAVLTKGQLRSYLWHREQCQQVEGGHPSSLLHGSTEISLCDACQSQHPFASGPTSTPTPPFRQ